MNITYINRDDRNWTENRFLLWFGTFAPTRIVVYADHLQDALDESIDWLVENAPGLICDEQVEEAYSEAIDEGKTEEEAMEIAEEDTLSGGNCGNRILSHEWGIFAENPSKEQIRYFSN